MHSLWYNLGIRIKSEHLQASSSLLLWLHFSKGWTYLLTCVCIFAMTSNCNCVSASKIMDILAIYICICRNKDFYPFYVDKQADIWVFRLHICRKALYVLRQLSCYMIIQKYDSQHDKSNKVEYAPSRDLDHPEYPHNWLTVFSCP